jgi:hypothetical protein
MAGEMLRMATVWLRLRADVRQRWRALAGLVVLLGLIGGVALTAAAGARRTDTAYPRLLQWASASQVAIIPQGSGLGGYYDALAKLPQVAQMTTAVLYQAALPGSRNLPVNLMASPDGGLGTRVDRVKVVRGAMFDPATPGVAVVDQQMAAREHLAPGDAVRVLAVPNDPKTGTPDFSKATMLAFRVTGIVVFDDQVVSTASASAEPTVLVGARSAVAVQAATPSYGDEAAVRLRPGASMSQFVAGADALAARYRHATTGQVDAISMADQVSATERAIRPQATALAIFAALTGLIALAVIGQLLARQLTMDSGEFPVLRAIGVTRPALVALSLARLAMVTLCGAVLAVVVAVTASPLMPIGPARLAEPHPGMNVDPAIVGAGAAIIALLPLAVLARAAWRTASVTRAPRLPRGSGSQGGPPGSAGTAFPERPSRLPGLLDRAGSVPGGIGIRMALEPGRGRTAVPVRSALAGTTVAVAAVVAATVFGTSLAGLVGTPRAYGQNWQERLDLGFGGVTAQLAAQFLGSYPSVTGYAGGDYGMMTVNGTPVAAIGVDALHGSGYLTLLAGRAPAAPGEIALGARTMATAHVRLGQDVRVVISHVSQVGPARSVTMRVVGEAIFPPSAGAASRRPTWAPGPWCPPPRCRSRRPAPAAASRAPATTSSCCGSGPAPT